MRALIVSDFHAYKYHGKLYVGTQFSTIVKRYKRAFGDIHGCFRITVMDALPAGFECAEELFSSYYGVKGLSAAFSRNFKSDVRNMISDCDLLVVRCPAMLGITAAKIAGEMNKPYLAEVMGDGWDAYWNHGIAGKLMAPYYHLQTKRCIGKADFALYVTEKYLQNRYPCQGLCIGASNVLIKDTPNEVLDRKIAHYRSESSKPLVLMTSASVDVRYKGQEYVIKAIPQLNKRGILIKYLMCGDGEGAYLKELTKKLGVGDQVVFTGRLSLDDIFKHLDEADIYIQPSLQEGLPRSVIEAMSRGCHVIGARTAGIPELLDDCYVVKRKSASDIVDKIMSIVNLSKEQKVALCVRNQEESKKYLAEVLDKKRETFFRQIVENINQIKNEKH